MRYNRRGDLAGGAAGAPTSVWLAGEASARTVTPGFGGGSDIGMVPWLDDDTIVTRDDIHGGLRRCRRMYGWRPDDALLLEGGFGRFVAGGGRVVAVEQVGLYRLQAFGVRLPDRLLSECWPVDAATDGTVLLCDFSSHYWAIWPNGTAVDLGLATTGRASVGGVVLILGDTLTVVRSSGERLVAARQPGGNINNPVLLGNWVGYAAEGLGRVLHPLSDASQGYRLTEGFSPDLFAAGGLVTPAFSRGPAELASELVREAPIRLGAGMADLRPVEVAMPEAPRLNRAFAFGAFFNRSNDTSVRAIEPDGIGDAPGTVEVPIRATPDQLSSLLRPAIVKAESWHDTPVSCRLAVYVELPGDDEAVAGAILAARAAVPGARLCVYDDRRGYRAKVVLPLLRRGDIVCPQWYLKPGETAAEFRLAMVDEVAALRDWPIVPAVSAYTRGGRLTRADLAACWRALFAIFQGYREVAGALYFAELRADGVRGDCAYLAPMLRAFSDGLTGVPAFDQAPAPGPTPAPIPAPTPAPAPGPASRWPRAITYGGPMATAVRGGLVGSGGFFGRVDPAEPKKIRFDRIKAAGEHVGGHEEVEARPLANGKWHLVYLAANVGLNGAPKWECGTDLDRQFETRPVDQLQGDEEWTGVVMPNGRIQFAVEHEAHGQKFSSVPLAFVENK